MKSDTPHLFTMDDDSNISVFVYRDVLLDSHDGDLLIKMENKLIRFDLFPKKLQTRENRLLRKNPVFAISSSPNSCSVAEGIENGSRGVGQL
jgi:hypothetical protein